MELQSFNADLHVHGLYSGAVSKDMKPDVIAKQAKLKGLHIVGTGDILHEKWLSMFKDCCKWNPDIGMFEHENGVKFLLQTEVEDASRAHHLLYFPDISKVLEVKQALKGKCKNFESDGRPKLHVLGHELVDVCKTAGCLLGFAHAFTPYTGLLALYNSYKESYGDGWRFIKFLELGLSADTDMADHVSELHELTFLSNSDAHSPWPNKLGREFNVLKMAEPSFKEFKACIERKNQRRVALNIGLDPREGKYHKTRCRKCLTFYDPETALKLNWRCPLCGGIIKKGVDYRIKELSDLEQARHPSHRPPYLHIIPLSEIIALAIGTKSVFTNTVQSLWFKLVKTFNTEINVLLNAPIEEISKVHENVGLFVQHFREGKIQYIPGGAGVYGKLIPPGKEQELENVKVFNQPVENFKQENKNKIKALKHKNQKRLTDF
ncbi:TIGR00375 family protein [Candidatus Woesearchaeota archaeon]|nr:TIGR00375 family protein [Candidatus Woesearchaeota archaeon]